MVKVDKSTISGFEDIDEARASEFLIAGLVFKLTGIYKNYC